MGWSWFGMVNVLEISKTGPLSLCSQSPSRTFLYSPRGSMLLPHYCEALRGRENTRYPGGAKSRMSPMVKQWEWYRGGGSKKEQEDNNQLYGRSQKKTDFSGPLCTFGIEYQGPILVSQNY